MHNLFPFLKPQTPRGPKQPLTPGSLRKLVIELWSISHLKLELADRSQLYYKLPHGSYSLDVLWGQPIKQNQVASTSELNENQRNDLLFFDIVPCHYCRASEVQT